MRLRPVVFLCLLSSFGIANYALADIVGGEEVQESDPIRNSTAALYEPSADGRGGALCTASFIGKDIAVTAAHCVHPGGPKPVLIFGRDIHSATADHRQVTAVAVNPQWKEKGGKGMDQGDIALVKFGGGLPDGYRSVKTAGPGAKIAKGDEAVLAGYGISDARKKSGAGILRKTKVSVANPRPGKSEMILDQARGHGACHGDSGGPAFIQSGGKTVLAGVTNRSYPTRAPDDCGHQVVYTKVGAYHSWIKKSEQELRAARPEPKFRLASHRMANLSKDHSRVLKAVGHVRAKRGGHSEHRLRRSPRSHQSH